MSNKNVVNEIKKKVNNVADDAKAAVVAQNIEASKSKMVPGEFSPFFFRENEGVKTVVEKKEG